MLTSLHAATLALSAALLFAVQPMVARMALPALGGSPAVWNTCMVFFQAAVLGGYALAHAADRRLCTRNQVAGFLGLVVLGVATLPVRLVVAEDAAGSPIRWLLAALVVHAGLPALVLAAASPLVQRWHAGILTSGRGPYVLYAASNAGSLAALLGYPTLLEPRFTLADLARLWAWAYAAWATLVVVCCLVRLRRGTCHIPTPASREPREETASSRLAGWIGLAAIPAALLQGCTLFLTTDVASVPLLWVVPLSLYLVTFIVAFSGRGEPAVRLANRALPFLACGLLFVILTRATQPAAALVALHLAFLFAAGLVCHGRLHAHRPPPADLTRFYLALSVGGVAGGASCAIAAPLLFNSVLEYPLAIALACAVLPPRTRKTPAPDATPRAGILARDLAWPVGIAATLIIAGMVTPFLVATDDRVRNAVVFGLPAVFCAAMLDRPRRLALALAATFAAGLWIHSLWAGNRHAERNFYGVTRVTHDAAAGMHQLVHGNTIHGRQFLDPARRNEPLAYYHRHGPLGSLLKARQSDASSLRVAVIGLGVGTMAAYARPGDAWTFLEIDPAVIRVATDTHWFRFLADAPTGTTRILQGDGRLLAETLPEASLDLLILDAFSSDAIPVHLLTREALAVYRARLKPDGWLVFHVSNRYLALEPVVAALARDGGWVARGSDDSQEGDHPGKEPSHWIVLARSPEALGGLARQSSWVPLEGADESPVWTDQRSSVLSVFQWR